MSADPPTPQLAAVRDRLQDLRRRLTAGPDARLLDDALRLLAEGSVPPPADSSRTELAEANRQLRTLLDNTLVGIYRTTRDGRVLYANDALAQILGYPSVQAFMAMNMADTYTDPAERAAFIAALESAGGRLVNHELTRRTPEGIHKHILTSATLEGDVLTGVVVDITDRKQVEDALRMRARELEAASAVAEEITRELDLQRLLDLITRRAVELVAADSGGVHLWDNANQALIPQATAGAALSPWQAEVRYRLGDGVVGTVAQRREGLIVNDYRAWSGAIPDFLQRTDIAAVLAEPLLYQGELLGVIAVTRPVGRPFTADAQRLLRLFASQAAVAIKNARLFGEEQAKLRQLEALRQVGSEITHELDLDRLLAAILDRAMELVGVSTGMILLWDEARQVLIPRVLLGTLATMPPDPIALGEGIVGRVAESRSGLIVNDYRAWAGARAAVLSHTAVIAGLAEPLLYRETLIGVINLGRTIDQPGFSEQDSQILRLFADQAAIAFENARLFQAEQHRREQLEAVRLVSAEVTRELDLDRLLELILRRAIELAGAEAGAILLWEEGRQALFPRVRTEEFFAAMPRRPISLDEGVVGRVARSRQGLIVNDYRAWSGARPQVLTDTAIAAPLAEPLIYRDQLIGVINLSNTERKGGFAPHHGALLRLFADQAAIAVQNAQLYQAMQQAFRNLQRAQEELLQSQKLRALGQLAAGIAHDLNNMLAAVLGQIELLKIRVAYPEVREALATLETAATDGAEIVRRIQDFARQRAETRLNSCSLTTAVAEAIEITRTRWKDEADRRGVAIAVRASVEDLPPILGNPPEIREALTNLIFNAVDAMPAGGTIELLGFTEGEAVLVSVRDTGVGMSEEIRSRVFEPFFTTKGVRGTGLGLSLVYGIMERHGGRVDVRSAPGRGSTFTLRFRRAGDEGHTLRPPTPAGLPPSRRILLVDDDPMVRRTTATLLRAVGQQVVEVDGGAAALAALAADAFDLVLTDLGMPDMTGWQVAEAVKERHPTLPVVLITGWQDQVAADTETRRFVDAILPKPSRLEDLLRVIRELGGAPDHRPAP